MFANTAQPVFTIRVSLRSSLLKKLFCISSVKTYEVNVVSSSLLILMSTSHCTILVRREADSLLACTSWRILQIST